MKKSWVGAGIIVFLFGPSLWAEDAPKPAAKTWEVPYRLTPTQHILVRAKINGNGPYNFIVDTGAPALFVSTAVCKKLDIQPDKKGWGNFDRFELEGGVVIEKARGRVEDPFQLEGMNGLGLAGTELHGIIGYNILARYRLEVDFTKDKLGLTPLDFKPVVPKGLDGQAVPSELDAMAGIIKIMAKLMGRKPQPEVKPRGFLGIELVEAKDAVEIKTVLADSPAARAGIKAGDRISRFQGEAVKSLADVQKLAAKLTGGENAKLTVLRGSDKLEITVVAGEGL